MHRGRTARVVVRRLDGNDNRAVPDELVVEEPLEVRLDDHLVATTMRTPGNDFELATGLCFTEGLLDGAEVREVRYCDTGSAVDTEFNVVNVSSGGRAPIPRPRLALTSASCGLCGSRVIEDLQQRVEPLTGLATFPARVLVDVPTRVQATQTLFSSTGGVHAAAAFDTTGEVVLVREDIGRHNAVDKVIGRLLLDDRLPAPGLGLFVSGRASFEIVQKAWAAHMAVVLAVSAPSALAVEAATRAGIGLAGFVRDERMNLYTSGPVAVARS